MLHKDRVLAVLRAMVLYLHLHLGSVPLGMRDCFHEVRSALEPPSVFSRKQQRVCLVAKGTQVVLGASPLAASNVCRLQS